MILLIDQGNSYLKWNSFNGLEFTARHIGLLEDLENYLLAFREGESKSFDQVLVSSVKSEEQSIEIINLLNKFLSAPIKFAKTSATFHQLKCAYDDFSKLGIDRWLAMIAVRQELSSAFMIVDAGSAVTLDVVDLNGQHLGGHIIPGLSMQQSQLLAGTDRVSFSTTKGIENNNVKAYELGKNTNEAVKNGCLTNICSYIEAMYERQSEKNALTLILTGGDSEKLSKMLSIKHKTIPDLVLRGLYYAFFI